MAGPVVSGYEENFGKMANYLTVNIAKDIKGCGEIKYQRVAKQCHSSNAYSSCGLRHPMLEYTVLVCRFSEFPEASVVSSLGPWEK